VRKLVPFNGILRDITTRYIQGIEVSAIAMTLISLQRFVLRTKLTLYYKSKATMDKRFTKIDGTALIKLLAQFGKNLFEHSLATIGLEPAVAGLMLGIA